MMFGRGMIVFKANKPHLGAYDRLNASANSAATATQINALGAFIAHSFVALFRMYVSFVLSESG